MQRCELRPESQIRQILEAWQSWHEAAWGVHQELEFARRGADDVEEVASILGHGIRHARPVTAARIGHRAGLC